MKRCTIFSESPLTGATEPVGSQLQKEITMKSTILKVTRCVSMLLVFVTLAGVAFAQANRHQLYLNNNSGYDIYKVYLSRSDDGFWGRDLLEDDVLASPGFWTITNIGPGTYDLKIVDEDGDECVRTNVWFYENRSINITPDWLLGCEFQHALRQGGR
jgi:hypothetical protein